METKDLDGLFLRGSLKNGNTFYGICIETGEEYLTLTGGKNEPEKKKMVKVSEIVELDAAPVRTK